MTLRSWTISSSSSCFRKKKIYNGNTREILVRGAFVFLFAKVDLDIFCLKCRHNLIVSHYLRLPCFMITIATIEILGDHLPTYHSTYPPTYLPTYHSTYPPTYLPTYHSTYHSTYPPTYLPTILPIILPTYHSTYHFTYRSTNLPFYLPTILPTYHSTYLPTFNDCKINVFDRFW